VADLTIEGLDELDALRKAYEAALAAGNAYEEWKAWQRALMKAVGGPTWPSVSAMLRRALVTAPAAVPDLVFGEREKYGGRRVATAADGAIYMATPEYSGRGGPLEREEGVSLRCPNETWGTSYPTEAEAIAAANAHNAARLAKKGGE